MIDMEKINKELKSIFDDFKKVKDTPVDTTINRFIMFFVHFTFTCINAVISLILVILLFVTIIKWIFSEQGEKKTKNKNINGCSVNHQEKEFEKKEA